MADHAVVMICGPHHPKFAPDGDALCTAFHQRTRCFSRLDHARKVAERLEAPLLVCGDANGGQDVDAYVTHARAYGLPVSALHWTGKDPKASNTLLDVRLALTAMLQSSEPFTGFTLVTDGWHMPRAYLLAFRESLRMCTESGRRQYVARFDACPQTWTPPDDMLARERAGVMGIADGTYGTTADAYVFGKPALEVLSRTG